MFKKYWLEKAKKSNKRFMNIICDTFWNENYPLFTDKPMKIGDIGNMQRVEEVFDIKDLEVLGIKDFLRFKIITMKRFIINIIKEIFDK